MGARGRAWIAGAAGLAFAGGGSPAVAASLSGLTGPQFQPATVLLSRSEHGGLPNGASCCGVVSHDERIGQVMAFESTASDIARGARLGVANVYAVFRRGPWSVHGSMWVPGRRVLVSRGRDGRPANGPSYAAAVSGDSAHPPRCVAFISRASNLVAGDGNGVADAFVADLASRRIERVSVASGGAEANRATTEVAVSGDCRRVAFTSAATNLTPSAGRPARQVYVRFLAGSGRVSGLTMLASGHRGRRANADASELSLSRDGTALAFVSAATDLGAPSRGIAQVWKRTITIGGSLSARTHLVSQAPGGGGGDGPSSRPSIDHDGRFIAFATQATDLLPGANGVAQIVRADTFGPTPVLNWISQSSPRVAVGADVSNDPKITDGGEWVFFDSAAENLEGPRGWNPAEREVFRWTSPDLVSSKDTGFVADRSLGGPVDLPARTGAWNPDTSARGTYLLFESDDQGLDPRLPHGSEPPWYIAAPSGYQDWFSHTAPALATLPSTPEGPVIRALPGAYGTPPRTSGDPAVDPRLHQVYVHYLGPDPNSAAVGGS